MNSSDSSFNITGFTNNSTERIGSNLVPTLCVGMQSATLCVDALAEVRPQSGQDCIPTRSMGTRTFRAVASGENYQEFSRVGRA
jgi:hypothetical protein